MKKSFRSSWGLVLVLFYACSAFALSPIQVQIDSKIPHGGYRVGVGSHLTMKLGESKTVDGVFLGAVVEPGGVFSKYMLLDQTNSKVYFAKQENVEIQKDTYQLVLKPYDQIGGTCTGYAIDHYLQQMYWAGFKGTGALKTELSTEKGRTQLLVDSINEYYLVLQHRYSLVGVMNKFGIRFGFKCKAKQFADPAEAVNFVRNQTNGGLPVLVSFLTGPDMVTAPYQLADYENRNSDYDNRLWVPRKKGQRESGGHSVVAAAYFEVKGRPTFLMLDSDWSEPRLWDAKAYFTEKTAMDEIEFITCN